MQESNKDISKRENELLDKLYKTESIDYNHQGNTGTNNKIVNSLTTEILFDIRKSLEDRTLTLESLDNKIKVAKSLYLQRKYIDGSTNYKKLIKEFNFTNSNSKFYYIGLRTTLL